VILSLLLACHKSVPAEVPPPDLLEPLEDVNLAPEVAADGTDPHPEGDVTFASGQFDDGVWWAHAKANVAAPVSTVWSCFQDVDTVVDRREVDEWSVVADPEPEFDFSMTIHQIVHDIVTIEYDTLWLEQVEGGDVTAPTEVVVVWQKSDGTDFIRLLSGSAVLIDDGDDVTRLELIAWLEASSRDDETLVSFLGDLAGSITACAHGDPLPVY
jgi:hypothetical protein